VLPAIGVLERAGLQERARSLIRESEERERMAVETTTTHGMNDARDVFSDKFFDRTKFLPVPATLDQFHNAKGTYLPFPKRDAGDKPPRLLVTPEIPNEYVGIENHRW
jgi:hypothetical protein